MKKQPTHSADSPQRRAAAKSSSSKRAYVAIARQYAEDVVAGKIPACLQVKQACQRQLKDLARQARPEFSFRFDDASAIYWCELLEAFPHVKGKWAKKRERLLLGPWQVFVVCCLFGWIEKSDATRYRFREGYVCIPRKNGKSILGAGVGNGKFAADGEFAAEVYFGATSEEQARRVGFKVARAMALASPEFCQAFGVKVNTHNLVKESDGSLLKAVIAKPGDGDSPSCAVIDEYHEHPSAELYDTMKTGMGARENPLMLVITTAGSNRGGPCYALQRDVERILAGAVVNERVFAIIYTLDPDDDWTSEAALIKANPNYGVSIDPEFLRNEQLAAMASARKQNTFKTKHLNIWVNAAVAWMNMEKWKALADPDLKIDDFEGEDCLIALDLASELDLAAKVYLFERQIDGRAHFYIFAKHYLNELAVQEARGEHYPAWAADRWLTVTPGNVTDYVQIADDLVGDAQRFLIREVPHDPYHAAALVQFVQNYSAWPGQIEFVKIMPNAANFSPAMKQLEAAVYDGRIHHNGDPVLEWMISNVVARRVRADEMFPDKESPERKIDGAVALMMDMLRATTQPAEEYTETEVRVL